MTRPRITGGAARGRLLAEAVPASARPTSSRVREAMFDLVGHDLTGQRVLDAFGGSGLLALEAWSRGAAVVCVERDPRALRVIRANVAAMGATVEVVGGDVVERIVGLGAFDGALVDPPYALPATPILDALARRVTGWLVMEGGRGHAAAEVPAGVVIDRERWYGDTVLRVYRREGT